MNASASRARSAEVADPLSRYFDRDRGALGVAAALAAALFAASWYRHATFRSDAFDLGVFQQAVWKLSRFDAPEVTLIGWNAFADHISPVLLLFVPLYWLRATPVWFFLAQAVAFGLGYLAVGPLAAAAGVRDALATNGLRAVYAVSPLLWNAVLFDFHPTTLAVPALLAGITAALSGDVRAVLVVSTVLVLLRDDLGASVTVLAMVGAGAPGAWRQPWRWALGAGGLAVVVLGGKIGEAMGSDRHWDARYGYLGESPVDALVHPWTTVPRLAEAMGTARIAGLAVAVLLTMAFLPLLSPRRLLLSVALLAPVVAADDTNFLSLGVHYEAPVFPFLLLAAATGVARILAGSTDRAAEDVPSLRPAIRRARAPAPVALVLAMTAVITFFTLGPPATDALTAPTVRREDAQRALALVRPGDGVTAINVLGPHVAHREVLRLFPYPFAHGDVGFPLSEKASEVSAAAAADIDVVLTLEFRTRRGQAVGRRFAASPYLDDFGVAGRFGRIIVWRRIAAAS